MSPKHEAIRDAMIDRMEEIRTRALELDQPAVALQAEVRLYGLLGMSVPSGAGGHGERMVPLFHGDDGAIPVDLGPLSDFEATRRAHFALYGAIQSSEETGMVPESAMRLMDLLGVDVAKPMRAEAGRLHLTFKDTAHAA